MRFAIGLTLEEDGKRYVMHQEIAEQDYKQYVKNAYDVGLRVISSSYTLPDGDTVVAAVGIARART